MEHKAKIVLAVDVAKKIKWFTYNYDNEIGAVGKVKIRNSGGKKYFYVYELLFPNQKVTGSTVHFTAEMWSDLFQEHGLEKLNDIRFYWHRHPGSAAHSSTDDEDTFEAFMSKEAKRSFFVFLQTAESNGKWDEEARIDIRNPIRTTINNDNIRVSVEKTEEDKRIEKECKGIIEKVIIEDDKTKNINWYGGECSAHYPAQRTFNHIRNKDNIDWEQFQNIVKNKFKDIEDGIAYGYFGNVNPPNEFDNDIITGVVVAEEEKFCLTFENGQATILAGEIISEVLTTALKKGSKHKLKQFVRQHTTEKKKKKALITKWKLQPHAKKYNEMRLELIRMYLISCAEIAESIETNSPRIVRDSEEIYDFDDRQNSYTIELDPEIIAVLLEKLEDNFFIEWDNKQVGLVYPLTMDRVLGEVITTQDYSWIMVTGETLINATKQIQKDIAKVNMEVLEEEQ